MLARRSLCLIGIAAALVLSSRAAPVRAQHGLDAARGAAVDEEVAAVAALRHKARARPKEVDTLNGVVVPVAAVANAIGRGRQKA